MDAATLPIRVDKSHLTTIGERLYSESIELIRELVNNAYDADATEVHVSISEDEVGVLDNGVGMDLEGLSEYFTIGTPDKRLHPRSPRLGRLRIGQFGIGKFATLSACERFTVSTQRGTFAAEVVFDKAEWARAEDRWDLPLQYLPPNPVRRDGTKVSLSQLRRRFDIAEVERHLIESVPLRAPDFSVFLNGRRLVPIQLAGHRIPILEGTSFGPIHGEIVIVPNHLASLPEMGIEIKVRQVTVRRELLGIDAWGQEASRIKGEVHADFLPVTADRSGFIRDSDEFRIFSEAMQRVLEEVRRVLHRLSDRRDRQKAQQAIREAFRLVQRALARNPDLSPFGPVPMASERGTSAGGAGVLAEHRRPNARGVGSADILASGAADVPTVADMQPPPKVKKRKPRLRRLTPDAVVQRVRFNEAGVTCCLDHLGTDGPESFHEGTAIYINRDHPLYLRSSKRRDNYTLHLARLLTQEISLMKDPRTPRQAFERQSKLLRDAFIDDLD